MLSAWHTFCIYLFYGIPSFVLYILTFYIILRYRKTFDSSFFQLYLFDGALNLFTFLNNYFKTRIPAITGYNSFIGAFYRIIANTFLLDFTMLMNFHMAYVQYAITTLVSLNRLSVMLKYNTFEPPIDKIFSVLIPFMVISTVFSIVINIFSVTIVRNLASQVRYKAESNFIIIACITCLVQLCGAVSSFIRIQYIGSPIAVTLATYIPFISDGLSLVQPWLLLAFSHVIRNKIIETIGRKKQNKSSVVIPRSTTFN
ncbi:hypothetical protein GCK72_016645 [Caenorhabditis remanei]|uniref:Serpentine receptor class gamma n=1 Tax=Caenorhabditis remanei TaxID=31234 RepID=A0A6A5G6J1_CAERE|nr:hypothetical protein GCK72_016645 [Caenorhabditis remanei]KAF1750099.1 hypothetical protein GCK72_016645 [Caenorhabditis remanei]